MLYEGRIIIHSGLPEDRPSVSIKMPHSGKPQDS